MDNAAEVRVDADILDAFTRYVYEHGVKEQNGIEAGMWREVLRVINDATVEGLVQSQVPTLEDNFLRELRHGNEVFAAFKVHTMGSEMQRQLISPDGKLKPFSQWRDDVQKIASHQCGAWLKTEYDTAVIRAHNAADWQEYERDKDIMPNLRWMPTTSKEPETKHRSYWLRRVNLPVDHPFWNEHHPGDRWNCKCTLEQNDDPIVLPPSDGSDSGATPHQGLENNPGKDGHIFNDTHPYFPKSCSECFANKGGSLKNRLKLLFRNQKKKDCRHCTRIDAVVYKMSGDIDAKNIFAKLSNLSGAEYIRQLRQLTELKIYKKVEKNILSAISKDSSDYANLLAGAKKAIKHGYKVFLLPNHKGVRSADYIFSRKGVYKMYDLKTITGTGSIGSRLKESVGQTNRVFLNLCTTYPTNKMATEIKQYFEINSEALEVLVAVGKKMVSIEKYMVSERNFYKEFRKRIEQ